MSLILEMRHIAQLPVQWAYTMDFFYVEFMFYVDGIVLVLKEVVELFDVIEPFGTAMWKKKRICFINSLIINQALLCVSWMFMLQ